MKPVATALLLSATLAFLPGVSTIEAQARPSDLHAVSPTPLAQPEQPKAEPEDILPKGRRWRGVDSKSITRNVVVTERSVKDNTATLAIKNSREVYTLFLAVKGSEIKVIRAERKVNGRFTDGDPAPEYSVRIDKKGVLYISGNGHFDAPGAKVKNKVFPLNLTCKPVSADDDGNAGKGKKGNKKKKGGNDSDAGTQD
ncbi:MAG: hypothetical protein KF745_02975 [Phycisphaeraceae bacterium]|nr:hypothetical protein [Phycisphaeraceae bacterium]